MLSCFSRQLKPVTDVLKLLCLMLDVGLGFMPVHAKNLWCTVYVCELITWSSIIFIRDRTQKVTQSIPTLCSIRGATYTCQMTKPILTWEIIGIPSSIQLNRQIDPDSTDTSRYPCLRWAGCHLYLQFSIQTRMRVENNFLLSYYANFPTFHVFPISHADCLKRAMPHSKLLQPLKCYLGSYPTVFSPHWVDL